MIQRNRRFRGAKKQGEKIVARKQNGGTYRMRKHASLPKKCSVPWTLCIACYGQGKLVRVHKNNKSHAFKLCKDCYTLLKPQSEELEEKPKTAPVPYKPKSRAARKRRYLFRLRYWSWIIRRNADRARKLIETWCPRRLTRRTKLAFLPIPGGGL